MRFVQTCPFVNAILKVVDQIPHKLTAQGTPPNILPAPLFPPVRIRITSSLGLPQRFFADIGILKHLFWRRGSWYLTPRRCAHASSRNRHPEHRAGTAVSTVSRFMTVSRYCRLQLCHLHPDRIKRARIFFPTECKCNSHIVDLELSGCGGFNLPGLFCGLSGFKRAEF